MSEVVTLIADQPELPDHAGENYTVVLIRLHGALRPKTYLEVGVFSGFTLQFSRCASIGVDPAFKFNDLDCVQKITDKPALHLFQSGSDEFFASHSPTAIFGRPVDMAFLDGMHRCEFLLRDFINTERHCRRNSVVILHDCLPLEAPMTVRAQVSSRSIAPHRAGWWTGDVWRTALLLRRCRPDLAFTVLDAAPTGLILITNLDPDSTILADNYQANVEEMMSWDLGKLGIRRFFDEMKVEPTSVVGTDDLITSRFWL